MYHVGRSSVRDDINTGCKIAYLPLRHYTHVTFHPGTLVRLILLKYNGLNKKHVYEYLCACSRFMYYVYFAYSGYVFVFVGL
jgi:hypothetical protein